ncbi:MAG TPA: hypothetical protein VGH97_13975 [Thermoanaerobaculia bacterium]|jgi:hypothetical protein
MGQLIAPTVWCRQPWCRADAEAEHLLGDGCTCDAHGDAGALEAEPRRITLTAQAARLSPFFCRACGKSARRMVEFPACFFRCEPCAAEDRWPEFHPAVERRRVQ